MPQSVMAGKFIYSGAIELPAGESEETLIKIKWTMGADKYIFLDRYFGH